jgi:hypothetical protein
MSNRFVLICWGVVGTVGPFAVWAVVYAAFKQRLFPAESMLRLVRAWRWIAWAASILILVCIVLPFHLSWLYAISASAFSAGLSFPESWLKLHVPPDASDVKTQYWDPGKWS